MQVIEAPHAYPTNPTPDIFLGGGITNCPDWQYTVISKLSNKDVVILNPRRTGEFTEDIAGEQIEWEYHALRAADTVFFWFPEETLCPITLLELGVFTQRPQTRIIVGTHPRYARRFDVIKQLELARPEVEVQDSITGLVETYLKAIGDDAQKEATALWESEQDEYARTLEIAKDEISHLMNRGTLVELHENVGANYKTVKARHLKAAINDLRGPFFYLTSDGRIVSPSK
jgi:hypothetical protein